ncbi:hypothetical protein Huta_0207 [Halorhabdus utahensis DSM 12940]|uniref:RCK C-terminal domain-containing protein n=1 Tax=Halorhabdus utahensis (strain DSM 12940 / JCM 11049 / AX-2) TaxID=519442 RepID=C7NPU8_HALUD|nr:hypothetical protein [Halorhabdus utahensis]ACV10395.1 hypothetical protein Huta_0207 [Halorhabdus utahensis DSM 12940]
MTTAFLGIIGSVATSGNQLSSLVPPGTRSAAVSLTAFALFGAITAGATAILYRRLTTRALPTGAGVLLSWLGVSLWVIVRIAAGGTVVAGHSIVLDATGYFLVVAFGLTWGAAAGGRLLGDALGCEIYDIVQAKQTDETAAIRRAARQPVSVELPETILDRSHSQPIDSSTKRNLEGSTWWFPRGLSRGELESRIRTRLERDHGIDRTEIALSGDREIQTLAVGHEPSGVTAALPPRTVGVAVRNEEVPAATVPDPIERWTVQNDGIEFAGRGTLQAATTDRMTLALPANAVNAATGNRPTEYTTKPAIPDDVNEVLSALRQSAHTISMLSIEEGDPLDGEFVGWLPVWTLVIVRNGTTIPFPADTETLRRGDDIYVLGDESAFYDLASFERERRSRCGA